MSKKSNESRRAKDPTSPGYADPRWGLTAEEALVDAHLRLVQGFKSVVVGRLPRTPKQLPLARLFAHSGPDSEGVAVLPGDWVRWMFHRKTGFSRLETYARTMLNGYAGQVGTIGIQIWDLVEPLPDGLLEKLSNRLEVPMGRFAPEDRERVLLEVRRVIEGAPPDAPVEEDPSWLVRSWASLMRDPRRAAPAPPTRD